jgi:hypothetical protein
MSVADKGLICVVERTGVSFSVEEGNLLGKAGNETVWVAHGDVVAVDSDGCETRRAQLCHPELGHGYALSHHYASEVVGPNGEPCLIVVVLTGWQTYYLARLNLLTLEATFGEMLLHNCRPFIKWSRGGRFAAWLDQKRWMRCEFDTNNVKFIGRAQGLPADLDESHHANFDKELLATPSVSILDDGTLHFSFRKNGLFRHWKWYSDGSFEPATSGAGFSWERVCNLKRFVSGMIESALFDGDTLLCQFKPGKQRDYVELRIAWEYQSLRNRCLGVLARANQGRKTTSFATFVEQKLPEEVETTSFATFVEQKLPEEVETTSFATFVEQKLPDDETRSIFRGFRGC